MSVSEKRKFLRRRDKKDPNSEMSFTDHIEELRWHIVRALIAVLIGGVVMFIYSGEVFDSIIVAPAKKDFLSYRIMCQLGELTNISALCLDDINLKFQNTELSGQFMMSFSVSFMLGFIIAFPYVFWEFWRFIKPALSYKELKHARGIVFWTSLLFFTGVLFAYYVIAPFTINFFANYTLSPTFENIITITNYYNTLFDLVLGIGLVFELPVVVYFLSRVGLLTPMLMRSKRSYAILIIFVLAAIITPPDMFSLWLVCIPLLILYQVSITISERAYKERLRNKD